MRFCACFPAVEFVKACGDEHTVAAYAQVVRIEGNVDDLSHALGLPIVSTYLLFCPGSEIDEAAVNTQLYPVVSRRLAVCKPTQSSVRMPFAEIDGIASTLQ